MILVGGIGLPWLRDLDYGTQWIVRMRAKHWPLEVMLEDLSYAAHRVLHTFQDLDPERVVLVGCMPRHIDPPGTIRRYRLDHVAPPVDEVHERLSEAVMGIVDLDHTMVVLRHWSAFPADTVIIEIEPEDGEFGLGFSDVVESTVRVVEALVRTEVGRATGTVSDAPILTPPTRIVPPVMPTPNMALFPRREGDAESGATVGTALFPRSEPDLESGAR